MIEQTIIRSAVSLGVHQTKHKIVDLAVDIFTRTLIDHHCNPDSVDSISDETLTAIALRCESACAELRDLHLAIALIRVALIECGRSRNTLAALRAPRKRQRTKNNEDHRYQFQLVKPDKIRTKPKRLDNNPTEPDNDL